jgi:hypothetical protein
MSIKVLNGVATAGNVTTNYVVPEGTQRRVLYGQTILTTDATVANRRVILSVLDASGTSIFDLHSGAVVAASQTDQHHEYMQGIFRETSFIGGALQVPIGKDMILSPGWSLRVTVDNGVAGDSHTTNIVVSDEHVGAKA